MPSLAKVIDVNDENGEFIVIVKVRGVGTKNFDSPVAKRAKFAAAREVGILADYIPTSLGEISRGENINAMMKGRWFGTIESYRVIKENIQQTVLYGIRLRK